MNPKSAVVSTDEEKLVRCRPPLPPPLRSPGWVDPSAGGAAAVGRKQSGTWGLGGGGWVVGAQGGVAPHHAVAY